MIKLHFIEDEFLAYFNLRHYWIDYQGAHLVAKKTYWYLQFMNQPLILWWHTKYRKVALYNQDALDLFK